MSVVIRLGREADLGEVLALERQAATAPHWPEQEYRKTLRAGGEVRRCLLVACDVEWIVGFAAASVTGQGPEGEAEVESVVVRVDRQRRGVGQALLLALMEWCGREGAGTIRLEVRAGSAGAVSLYRGLGFAEIGVRRGYYSDPADDAIVMQRSLASGGQASRIAGM